MLQWNSLYRKAAVLVHHLLLGSVDGMKLYFVVEIGAECGKKHIEYGLEILGCIYGKRHSAAQQTERREHTYQSETVVAMDMRYEYCHYLVESYA